MTWCLLTCSRGAPPESPVPRWRPVALPNANIRTVRGVTIKNSEAGRLAPGVAVPDAGMTPDWFAAAPRPSQQGGSHPAAHATTILGCFVAACTKGRGCTAEFMSGGRPGTDKRDAAAIFKRLEERIEGPFLSEPMKLS